MEVQLFNRLPAVLLALAALVCIQVPAFASGALTLTVHSHPGDESLDVSGTAPAGTSVDLVLYGSISEDLPTVRINHFIVTSGPSGTFALNVPVAANFTRGTVITVQATGSSGASAIARINYSGPGSPYIESMDAIPSTPF